MCIHNLYLIGGDLHGLLVIEVKKMRYTGMQKRNRLLLPVY